MPNGERRNTEHCTVTERRQWDRKYLWKGGDDGCRAQGSGWLEARLDSDVQPDSDVHPDS